ncbi:MAG: VWA domain-containing protein [Gammaproteobacteria bacterium]|nr:VWA domain-containing protein [Gammaproteobacteria bacterium]
MTSKVPVERTNDVNRFLQQVEKHPLQPVSDNRLIFALDATASRELTWDLASSLHAELFKAAKSANLAVQLVHFGGFNQFQASSWNSSPEQLLRHMQQVRCLGGMTQIRRVLSHILNEASADQSVKAAVYIGDMCEEPMAEIVNTAGQLGLRQVPVFVFQEGTERYATEVFRSIAERSGGAHMPFESGSAAQLRELLKAAVVYATEGLDAVRRLGTPMTKKLLTQIKR